jgi:hypothetical protein
VTSVVLFGAIHSEVVGASVAQASSHVLQEGGGERSQVDDAACPRVGKLVRKEAWAISRNMVAPFAQTSLVAAMTQAATTVCEKQRAIFRHAELEFHFPFSTSALTI